MLTSTISKQQDLKKSLDLVTMEKKMKEEANQQLEKEIKDRFDRKSLSRRNNNKYQLNDLNPISLETNK